jgi:tripartite-type tricarboxylate transporter receptor subunit TctC
VNVSRLAPTIIGMCVALSASPAIAQSYPDKPIRIIVPSAPGGPTDVPARLASQILQPKLGQPIVVENRPGAAGALGARSVIASSADGYTLLVGNTSVLAVVPSVSASAAYDPTKNFAAIAKVSESYQILVVHPSSPWKTIKELADYAKANPGKLNYAHTVPAGCRISPASSSCCAPASVWSACPSAVAERPSPACSTRRSI